MSKDDCVLKSSSMATLKKAKSLATSAQVFGLSRKKQQLAATAKTLLYSESAIYEVSLNGLPDYSYPYFFHP